MSDVEDGTKQFKTENSIFYFGWHNQSESDEPTINTNEKFVLERKTMYLK